MFGYNKLYKNTYSTSAAKALLKIQTMSVLERNGFSKKESLEVATTEIKFLEAAIEKDEVSKLQMNNKNVKWLFESMRFHAFDQEVASRMIIDNVNLLKNKDAQALIVKQMAFNFDINAKAAYKNYGLTTRRERIFEVLNNFQETKTFKKNQLSDLAFVNVNAEFDEFSTVDILDLALDQEGFTDIAGVETTHKMKEIKKVLEEKPFLEGFQQIRFFKRSLSFLMHTKRYDLMTREENRFIADVDSTFKGFSRGAISKGLVKKFDLLEFEEDDFDFNFDDNIQQPTVEEQLSTTNLIDFNDYHRDQQNQIREDQKSMFQSELKNGSDDSFEIIEAVVKEISSDNKRTFKKHTVKNRRTLKRK